MPQTKSAKKALKQTAKKAKHNLQIKKKIEYLTRQIEKALKSAKLDEVEKLKRLDLNNQRIKKLVKHYLKSFL